MKNIAVVFGGNSGEFEVSKGSGQVVASCLLEIGYIPYLICVKGKDWFYQSENSGKVYVNKDDFSLTIQEKKITFDCVFNAIHGDPGENGRFEGFLELLGIPCTSSGMTTSAITFHKNYCNRVVASYGVNVAKSVVIRKGDVYDAESIAAEIGFPCFAKPCSSGSSVGVSKVNRKSDLSKALEQIFDVDEEAMIECYLPGREFGCGVYEANGELHALPLTEIISENDFFDYEAKYTSGKAQEITPPQGLDEESAEVMRNYSTKLFRVLNCKGFVRFDYILKDNKEVVFLEVNTVPGLSLASIIPQQVAEAGMQLKTFFKQVVDETIKRS